ncbi:MAG: PIN domain-containing protein [Deltaproteobacteria bacterium]
MIAVDTSSMVAFLKGDGGSDVNAVEEGLRLKQVVIPPVVLSELLSAKNMSKILSERLQSIQMLEITEGYWVRVGSLRQHILRNGKRARLADSLIAQSCIDHGVGLITRDKDFKTFERYGLKLAVSWH